MVITKISDHGVKITQGNFSIAVNPTGDKSKVENGTFSADLVLLSAPASDFDSDEHFIKKDESTFVVDSPGEYEKDDLFVYGMSSTTNFGGNNNLNTMYYLQVDGIDICILGAHEPDALPQKVLEMIDNIDVLILPISGDEVMGPIAANKLATKLEAKVVIPVGKNEANLKVFKEEFSHEINTTDKINLKSSDITTVPKAFILK